MVESRRKMLSKLDLFIEGKSLRTQKTYESIARSLHRFMQRHGYKLEDMAPYAMKQWVTSFKSMNSQACAKRFLAAYLRFIGRVDLVASLTATLKEVRAEYKFTVDLDRTELMQILKACPPLEYRLAVSLMGFNSLRPGECLGLFWRDIDLKEGTISLQKREGLEYGPKGMRPNDKSQKIPLNPVSARLYRDLWNNTGEHEGRILKMSYQTSWRNFKHYTGDVDLGNRDFPLTPHKLRHALAHLWLNNKGNMRKLQAVLRHKKSDTTAIYTKPSTEKLKD